LWTLTLDGKAAPLLATSAQERDPRLSPDGRWLAYQSNTAGRDDVYVASFPSLATTQLVSIDGTSPRWAGAREIVYRRGRQVVSVPVTPSEKLTLGRSTVLFELDDASSQYDVAPDGTTFLMLRRDAPGAWAVPGQVNLVLNVFEELKRRVPTSGFFARHLRTIWSSISGVIGRSVDTAAGSRSSIAATMLAWLLPPKARCAVSISYSTAPKAKTSLRASASRPSKCSGAM
jgi:WD40 repeat protein